jgi:hypothetical protein
LSAREVQIVSVEGLLHINGEDVLYSVGLNHSTVLCSP